MSPVICPDCKRQNQTSTVRCLGVTTTLLGWGVWHDEDGNPHSSNPNTRTSGYKCSNGHYFEITTKGGAA